jgi:mono/diheme cytochrome c family protein
MKRIGLIAAALVVLGLVVLFVITRPAGVRLAQAPDFSDPALIEQGHYLTIAGDCEACHTRHDGEPFAGGRGLETPFGVIYAPNITSDEETGLGGWSREEFHRAMRHGQGQGGRNLYPAFSYPYYSKVTDGDVDAIWAYLLSVPAVSYDAPDHELGFPYNIRLLLKGWNLLHFRGGEFQPDPEQSEEWNRGAYLVEGLGHCGACHTPKNGMGGDRRNNYLEGGTLEGWFASDLTGNEKTGVGNWTEDDIVEFLQIGANQYTSAYGTMAEVVRLSTSQLTSEDLYAMATYLKSIPAGENPPESPAPDAEVMAVGQRVYMDNCADCHLEAGEGIAYAIPVLAGSPNVNAADPSSIIQITLTGTNHPENPSPYGATMDDFPELLDEQIAAVATYIRNSWGNNAPAVEAAEVAEMRAYKQEEIDLHIQRSEEAAAAEAAAAAAEAEGEGVEGETEAVE